MGKVASNISNILFKAVGAAGLGLVVYDSHKTGKIQAPLSEKTLKSKQLSDHFFDNTKLEGASEVRSKANKLVLKYFVDENLTSFFSNIGGYIKGFTSMLINNVVPLGLAIGTLVSPKGFLSKAFGVGLLAYGGIFMLQKAFGIGTHKNKVLGNEW